MNLPRLKHAYARGARIQCLQLSANKWRTCEVGPQWYRGVTYRIHPDDSDKAYGPLSTALRESVLYKNGVDDSLKVSARWAFRGLMGVSTWDAEGFFGKDLNGSRMFYLFMAEALADEGL